MIGELSFIAFLLLVNGFFAMSELAVVSSRVPRLQVMADEGRRGARLALRHAQDTGPFLSAVQVGITLVGIFTGAYSGALLATPLSEEISKVPAFQTLAYPFSLAAVVLVVTYFSLVVGELVPKQLALRSAETIATIVAPPLDVFVRLTRPVVWVLDRSTRVVLRALGSERTEPEAVSEEEVKAVIAAGTRAGVLHPEEEKMIAGVMRLADRRVRTLMTPRPDVEWIDLDDDPEAIRKELCESTHSRLPAARGSLEGIVGLVQAKDLLDGLLEGRSLDLAPYIKPFDVLHDNASALAVLDVLRRSPIGMVVVVDEYGAVEGLVTATDVLEAIIGAMAEELAEPSPIVRREDGSWLIDGDLPLDEVAEELQLKGLREDHGYSTLAGFVLHELGRMPRTGDAFTHEGLRFEVVDMDGHRIDKLLVSREPDGEDSTRNGSQEPYP